MNWIDEVYNNNQLIVIRETDYSGYLFIKISLKDIWCVEEIACKQIFSELKK